MLSLIVFLPALAALALFFIPQAYARWFALAVAGASFLLAFKVWCDFDTTTAAMQFTETFPWIPQLGIHYALGIDGISLPLVALTAFISPIAWLGTWPKEAVKKEKFFVACALLLQTGMYGTFLSTDLFLFYFFWEVVLIPMFFVITIAAAESAVGLSILVNLYRNFGSIITDRAKTLQG